MRLKAFCEFPYLYVGNEEEELLYTQEYASTPQGLLVVAFKDDKIAGLSRLRRKLAKTRLRVVCFQ